MTKSPLLYDAGFSARTYNVLTRVAEAGDFPLLIEYSHVKRDFTLADITLMDERLLLAQRNFGRRSLLEVKSVLAYHGVALAPDGKGRYPVYGESPRPAVVPDTKERLMNRLTLAQADITMYYVNQAIAAERERCAKVADDSNLGCQCGDWIAERIRSGQ
tara:strand:- start:3982 stop:4461 length:480 start_codon:yes stop_codon:yes gene_type:complete